jgi:hypothetical protein
MIVYISGIQGAGKTTLCNVITLMKRDLNLHNAIETKDMDAFVKHPDNESSYFDRTEFNEFIKIHKHKTIILCGLLGYLKHIKLPSDTIYRYIELNSSLLKKNCLYRFFNQKDIYNFLTQPLFKYFKISAEECESIVNERVIKDEEYVETFDDIEIVRFNCFTNLIRDIFRQIGGIDYENIDIDQYVDNYLIKLNIKNYSIFIVKFILLMLYFIPSYIMKGFHFNIWMPVYYFFFPQFHILDSINLLFFIALLKRFRRQLTL